jgi:hypothetical protein
MRMPKTTQITGTKFCKSCSTVKSIDEFYLRTKNSLLRHSTCKECDKERSKKNHKPDDYFNLHLKRNYGITLQEHQEMYKNQNGVCAICKGEGDGKWKKLCVDHDHKTGKVRQLLCRNCNMVLGQVGDNANLLEEMIKYLQKHQ